jgi:hypothetical protein
VSLAIKSLSVAARQHRTVWYGSLHGLSAISYQPKTARQPDGKDELATTTKRQKLIADSS